MSDRSPLDRLRMLAQERTAKAELYLPIPGARWAGELVAKIAPIGDDEARLNAEQIAAEVDAGVERSATSRNADVVAMFTAGLYMADETGQMKAIPGPIGAPMRFGPEFAAAIGETATTPRAAVCAAFTEYVGNDEITVPVLNVTGLANFAGKVAVWVADTSREVAEAIVPGR